MRQRLRAQIIGIRQQVAKWFMSNPLGMFLAVTAAFTLLWLVGQTVVLKNLGFDNKSFWDWLDLLVIPIALALVVWLFDRSERRSDRVAAKERSTHELDITGQRIEADRELNRERSNQQTLELCLEYVSEQLMNLHLGAVHSSIQMAIIRARVLEVIDSLSKDWRRRDQLLRFLQETNLLSKTASEPLFQGAQLVDLDMSQAKLHNSCFKDSDLALADFTGAELMDASFEGATLQDVNFERAQLLRVNFERAKLKKVSFVNAHLEGASLSNTEPEEVDFTSATLRDAKLKGANLSYINLAHADLSDANLSGAILKSATLISTRLVRAELAFADLREAKLQGADLGDAKLDFVKLRGAELDEVTVLSQKWRDVWELHEDTANRSPRGSESISEDENGLLALLSPSSPKERFRKADLTNADLADLFLQGLDLTETLFENSLLQRADLTDAILVRANFRHCDLSDASLADADLSNCDLTNAIVTVEQLRRAKNVPPAALREAIEKSAQ